MSTRFKVGDVVTGRQIATKHYSVTIRGTIMKVVEVCCDMIRVRVDGVDENTASTSIKIAHQLRDPHEVASQIAMIRRDAEIGSEFSVHSRYFEVYIPDEDYASELNDFLDGM